MKHSNVTARKRKERRTDPWDGVKSDNRLHLLLHRLYVSPRTAVVLHGRLGICLQQWLGVVSCLASLLPRVFLHGMHQTFTFSAGAMYHR